MLPEIISFGGRWKDVRAIVRERISRERFRKGENAVRLKAESDEKSVLVQIKVKQRDTAEKIDEMNEVTGKPTGKKVDNPRYGKFYYASFDSLELEQATPEEVRSVVKEAIIRASNKK
jgi:hypothetical protein